MIGIIRLMHNFSDGMRPEECESSNESELSDNSSSENDREDSQLSGGERDGGWTSKKGEFSFCRTRN